MLDACATGDVIELEKYVANYLSRDAIHVLAYFAARKKCVCVCMCVCVCVCGLNRDVTMQVGHCRCAKFIRRIRRGKDIA